jgi:glutaredoxin
MKSLIKIIIIIIIAIIIVSSIYVIFYMDEDNNNNNNNNGNNTEVDDTPPTIDSITGDTSAKSGESVTIEVSFSDNVEVTEAIIYYKQTGGDLDSGNILSGSYSIDIPSGTDSDWFYYVIIDDEAGNGPVGSPSSDGSKFHRISVFSDNGNGNQNDTRIVFIEETTDTGCRYCVPVAKILYKLYNPDDPDFYYVSLVDDESSKARNRAENELNRHANPTVYIDGGYKLRLGFLPGKEDEYEEEIIQKIKSAANRDVPQLKINLDARWNDTRKELKTEITLENLDSNTYSGSLRVYLSEIQSRWIDYAGDPFHFAFIDYSINRDVTLEPGGNKSYSEIWNASQAGFSDIYPENIQVIAVVLNSEKNQGYAFPPDNNPFDAYYVDIVTATKVREGTLPPTIGIVNPVDLHRHYFNLFHHRTWISKRTVLIGRAEINVSVEAEAGVDRVEFYIDGELKFNDTEAPYKYSFRKIGRTKRLFLNSKHTIEVRLIDKENKIATDTLDVITYFL